MTPKSSLKLLILLLSLIGKSLCLQNILLPFRLLDTDYILSLASFPTPSAFHYTQSLAIDNNVIPLSQADEDVYQPQSVPTSHPFYNNFSQKKYSLQLPRFQIEYCEGNITSITGNYDAAQLWVDAKSNSLNPSSFFRPSAIERRTYAHWLGLGYQIPFKGSKYSGELFFNFRSLQIHRYREWHIRGTFIQDRLLGDLELVSSRGINFFAPEGKGFCLDFLASLNTNDGWRSIFAIEGLLGEIRWDKLRKLEAQIDTSAFSQDPEGFIHDLPYLTGKEEYISLKRRVDRQILFGLGKEKGKKWILGAMFSDRVAEPIWHFFAVRKISRKSIFLYDVQVPSGTVSAGYIRTGFSLIVSLSHPNPREAYNVGVQASITLR
jgi:hypothetical protein